ncbi:MAG: pyruvate kinase [Candidatus Sericytochromatia bacterium]|nr:pyruvate kinase [Candidatus Sericytochromatia bacterium]
MSTQPESLAARLPKVGLSQRKGTKIVATLGPSSSSDEMVARLMAAGVDVFRLNFSHGDHDTHRQSVERIRRLSREAGRHIAILQDIQGPKIRIGKVQGGEVQLVSGQSFVFTPDLIEATTERAHVSYDRLAEDVPVGHTVLVDDGRLELVVTEVKDRDIVCQVVIGGPLRPNKGVNFPGSTMRISILTDKDKRDLALGAEVGVDFVAASFVQSAADVLEVKEHLRGLGVSTPVIAKVERPQALTNLRDIVLVSDGIMIARGDLGVEIPVEDVPLVQKRIIRMCNDEGKPVITATQMLDSMIQNPRPTRAEATDVANAILDGTDAVMLSNETAAGQFPLEAVEVMVRIALQTERAMGREPRRVPPGDRLRPVQDSLAHAVTNMAPELGAAAILTATYSGSSARMVSKYRPSCPILAATPHVATTRHLALVWGVEAVLVPETATTDELFQETLKVVTQRGFVDHGDIVLLVAGVPMGQPGTTNLVKVEVVTRVIASGVGIGQRPVAGVARWFDDPDAALAYLEPGDILLAETTDAAWTPVMARAGAVIVRSGGLTSHTAIVGLELRVPVLLSCEDIESIPTGEVITLDPGRGVVYPGHIHI